jgi:hypothetical protein
MNFKRKSLANDHILIKIDSLIKGLKQKLGLVNRNKIKINLPSIRSMIFLSKVILPKIPNWSLLTI